MELELILFKACPFAQRVVITLLQTKLAHQSTFINPGQPPEWLQKMAPLGQIPLLRVNRQTILFDSSAINEYLNDLVGGGLFPNDVLARARCRCWIEFSGVCQRAFGQLITARDETEFYKFGQGFLDKLRWLEEQLESNRGFFVGDHLSLVDIAYAPLFMRMQYLQNVVPFHQAEHAPNIDRWQSNLMALSVVQRSVEGDFSIIFRNMVRGRGKGGFVDSLLG